MLLCDEPTGAVDPDTGRRILALLRGISARDRRTVLLVTHNSAIAGMADRVLRMRSGELSSDESIERPVDPRELEW